MHLIDVTGSNSFNVHLWNCTIMRKTVKELKKRLVCVSVSFYFIFFTSHKRSAFVYNFLFAQLTATIKEEQSKKKDKKKKKTKKTKNRKDMELEVEVEETKKEEGHEAVEECWAVKILRWMTGNTNISIQQESDSRYWKVVGCDNRNSIEIEVIYITAQPESTVKHYCLKRRQDSKRSDYLPFVKIIAREECAKHFIIKFEDKVSKS